MSVLPDVMHPSVLLVRSTLYGASRNAIRTFGRSFLVFIFFGELPAFGLDKLSSGRSWHAVVWLPVAAIAALVVRSVVRAARLRAEVSADGIFVHGVLRDRRLAWADICGVTVASALAYPLYVAAKTCDGALVPLAAAGRTSEVLAEAVTEYARSVLGEDAWPPAPPAGEP